MVPRTELGRKGAVGLPVWLWVKEPDALTWGPFTKTATLGGVTVTATANVRSVTWDMGDGEGRILCTGPGTVYTDAAGAQPSPTCGYRYAKMSPNEGALPYTITATSSWAVDWTAAGQSGSVATQANSQTQVRIGELQTVLVNP